MFGLIRFSCYFIFSTLILSLPFNNQPLFYSVQKYSTPITNAAIWKIKTLYGDIFLEKENTNKVKEKIDQISSSLSSSVRKKFSPSPQRSKRQHFFKTKEHKPHHDYDPTERKQLEKIFERE